MDMEKNVMKNPLRNISVDFQGYVERRKRMNEIKLDGNGLPNYAFAMDYELRKKLDSIPGLYDIGKKIVGTYVTRQTQIMNMNALRVGPDQFPDVYEIACDCAEKLGIGIPNVFILNDPTMNAFTYAYDDQEPMIVIHSGLYERMTKGELRAIIGHECGHIHNQHGLYDTLGILLLSTGLTGVGAVSRTMGVVLSESARIALSCWSRAAEITCDRAGMICSENLEDCYSSMAKLMYGATFKEQKIDYDAIQAQLEVQMKNIGKYDELLNGYSHPTTARRIASQREFSVCETLYQWRPDMKQPGMHTRTKHETDENCRRYVDITKKG